MVLKYENLEENSKTTSYIRVFFFFWSITQYIQILLFIKFCLVQVS